jgi:FKBP-type peptidyl-prolyl cis-trans isomerase FklB
MAQTALEKGQEFLKENGKKPGVKTTASGLQYTVLKEGTGKQPKATDTVEVNYEGKLLDGTVFDSSYKRGQSISFPLNQVIPGWTEGVALMKEGAKYEFFIPSNLAYGSQGAGGAIGPDETLIFTVELIKVK